MRCGSLDEVRVRQDGGETVVDGECGGAESAEVCVD